MKVRAWPVQVQVADVDCAIVDDQMHVEFGRNTGFYLVENFAELDGTAVRVSDDPAGGNVEDSESLDHAKRR